MSYKIYSKKQLVIVGLIILSLFSCKGKRVNQVFNEGFFLRFISSDIKKPSKFLLIPGSGCAGCISQAEQYVIENAEKRKNEIVFIFTNIGSKKLLKLRLGQKVMSQPNVLLDSTNYLHFHSIYPVLVEKKSNTLEIKEMNGRLFYLD